jgi:hypothetical protein
MTLNRDRIFQTVQTLDIFVNHCLNLQPKIQFLPGFEYNRGLLKAAMANTYLEIMGSKADSIHLAIKKETSPVIPMAMPKPIPRTSALQITVPTALLHGVGSPPDLRWDVSGDGSATSPGRSQAVSYQLLSTLHSAARLPLQVRCTIVYRPDTTPQLSPSTA